MGLFRKTQIARPPRSSSVSQKIFSSFLWSFLLVTLFQIGALLLLLPRLSRYFEQEVYARVAPALAEEFARTGATESALHDFSLMNSELEAYILDANGKILTSPEPKFLGQKIDPEIFRELLDETYPSHPVCGINPREPERCAAISVAKLTASPTSEILYLVASHGPSHFFEHREGRVWALPFLLPGVLVVGLLYSVLGALLARYYTRDLRKMAETVGLLERDDQGLPLQVERRTELTFLAHAINILAASVRHQREELRQSGSERRAQLASVVHDLIRPATNFGLILRNMRESKAGPLVPGDQAAPISSSEKLEIQRRLSPVFSVLEKTLEILREFLNEPDSQRPRNQGPQVQAHTSLAKLIPLILQQYQQLLSEKRISCHFEQEEVPDVLLREKDLASVVLNLVDNAIRYTPVGGAIVIRIGSKLGLATLEVEDSGTGVPPEEAQAIFRYLHRSALAISSNPQGKGLGLSSVRRILLREGATIAVGKGGLGGAKFRCVLPTVENHLVPTVEFSGMEEGEADRRPKNRSNFPFRSRQSVLAIALGFSSYLAQCLLFQKQSGELLQLFFALEAFALGLLLVTFRARPFRATSFLGLSIGLLVCVLQREKAIEIGVSLSTFLCGMEVARQRSTGKTRWLSHRVWSTTVLLLMLSSLTQTYFFSLSGKKLFFEGLPLITEQRISELSHLLLGSTPSEEELLERLARFGFLNPRIESRLLGNESAVGSDAGGSPGIRSVVLPGEQASAARKVELRAESELSLFVLRRTGQRYVMFWLFAMLLASLAVASLSSFLIFSKLRRRISGVEKIVRGFGEEGEPRYDASRLDEIDEIAAALRRFTKKIIDGRRELLRDDEGIIKILQLTHASVQTSSSRLQRLLADENLDTWSDREKLYSSLQAENRFLVQLLDDVQDFSLLSDSLNEKGEKIELRALCDEALSRLSMRVPQFHAEAQAVAFSTSCSVFAEREIWVRGLEFVLLGMLKDPLLRPGTDEVEFPISFALRMAEECCELVLSMSGEGLQSKAESVEFLLGAETLKTQGVSVNQSLSQEKLLVILTLRNASPVRAQGMVDGSTIGKGN